MSTLTYIKNFIRDPRVASITPTSAFGVQRVCDKIDFEHAGVIVEYGPGTGIITEQMLARMRPDSRLVLIERNQNFASILARRFQDPRVVVRHDDAQNVLVVLRSLGIEAADYVVSGIPFSLLKPEVREHIVQATSRALRSGGRFVAYQTFWQPDEHLHTPMTRHFSNVDSEFVLLNAPPIRLYDAHKNGVVNGARRSS